jgi:hypothetical protein
MRYVEVRHVLRRVLDHALDHQNQIDQWLAWQHAGVVPVPTDSWAPVVVTLPEGATPSCDPARFDVDRAAPRTFTFGLTPAWALATTIAVAGVEALMATGVALDGLADGLRYRPSVNARIPLFGAEPG